MREPTPVLTHCVGLHFVYGTGEGCLRLVAVGWDCLTQVPRKPSIRISQLKPASLSLGGSPPDSNRLWRSKVYRLAPEAPIFGRNADEAQGIFGTTGRMWATVLRLVPTIKRPCAVFERTLGARQISEQFTCDPCKTNTIVSRTCIKSRPTAWTIAFQLHMPA